MFFATSFYCFVRAFDSFYKGVGEAEFAAEGGFAGGHLSVVGLVIEAGEVEETVEEEDSYLVAQGVTIGGGLASGGFKGDGKVACLRVGDLGRCGET